MLPGRVLSTGKVPSSSLTYIVTDIVSSRIMGALGNSGRKLANLAGFYKGLQSAGAAVMWSLDEKKLPYMNEYASNFGLLCGSILVAVPVVFFKIKDSVPVEEEIEGTGETLEDVLPLGAVESKRVGEEKI